MPRCVVVADDLTGANATGVLLTKIGLKTYTIMNTQSAEQNCETECDCLVIPTDTRSKGKQKAYDSVFEATNLLKGPEVKLYSKRIDSTLRGNLGAETDAMLDALGNGSVAMVVPCYPKANRILVGGHLLVNALPLEKTEAANDPINPMKTSDAKKLFEEQSKYPVGSVSLEDLNQGTRVVAQKLREMRDGGFRTVIFDSVTQEDIDRIAESVVSSGLSFIAVDPGIFTCAAAKILITPSAQPAKQKVLAVIGSVNAVTKNQVDELFQTQKVKNEYVNIAELLESKERCAKEIKRVADCILEGCGDYEVCSVVGSGLCPEQRVPFEPYMKKYNWSADVLSGIINRSMAEIAERILKADSRFRSIYSCGGDITVAIFKRLGVKNLRLLDEVVPLASFGEMVGGEFSGLKIITKGGMVGDRSAVVTCIQYLKGKFST